MEVSGGLAYVLNNDVPDADIDETFSLYDKNKDEVCNNLNLF